MVSFSTTNGIRNKLSQRNRFTKYDDQKEVMLIQNDGIPLT